MTSSVRKIATVFGAAALSLAVVHPASAQSAAAYIAPAASEATYLCDAFAGEQRRECLARHSPPFTGPADDANTVGTPRWRPLETPASAGAGAPRRDEGAWWSFGANPAHTYCDSQTGASREECLRSMSTQTF